jgi:hypothetical protein
MAVMMAMGRTLLISPEVMDLLRVRVKTGRLKICVSKSVHHLALRVP